ncbi:hypothetical protein ACFL5T_02475 [Gemmatimonadota bacterium]
MPVHDSRVRFPLLAVLGVALAACSSSGTPQPEIDLAPVEAQLDPATGAGTITADQMLAHISFLASDELEGRDTPSPGLEKAAVYLQDAFRAAGLEPAGDEGSYLQRWTFEKTSLRSSDAVVAYTADGGTVELEHAVDFFVLPSSEEVVTSEMVFLGSIDALLGDSPPDATGRMAVVTTPPSMGMEILVAAKAAGEAGATGLILILDPAMTAEVIGMVAGQIEGAGLPLQRIPTVGVTWDVAGQLVDGAGVSLDDLTAGHEADPGDRGSTVLDGVELTIRTPLDRETSTPPERGRSAARQRSGTGRYVRRAFRTFRSRGDRGGQRRGRLDLQRG